MPRGPSKRRWLCYMYLHTTNWKYVSDFISYCFWRDNITHLDKRYLQWQSSDVDLFPVFKNSLDANIMQIKLPITNNWIDSFDYNCSSSLKTGLHRLGLKHMFAKQTQGIWAGFKFVDLHSSPCAFHRKLKTGYLENCGSPFLAGRYWSSRDHARHRICWHVRRGT